MRGPTSDPDYESAHKSFEMLTIAEELCNLCFGALPESSLAIQSLHKHAGNGCSVNPEQTLAIDSQIMWQLYSVRCAWWSSGT